MGGAIGRLPRGKGNITPAAEFNFWVDPEAARIVLHSGANITLMPLNVCLRSYFARSLYDRIVDPNSDHPEVADLFRRYIGPRFDDPELDRREPVLSTASSIMLASPMSFVQKSLNSRPCASSGHSAGDGLWNVSRLRQGRLRLRGRYLADREQSRADQSRLRYGFRRSGRALCLSIDQALASRWYRREAKMDQKTDQFMPRGDRRGEAGPGGRRHPIGLGAGARRRDCRPRSQPARAARQPRASCGNGLPGKRRAPERA